MKVELQEMKASLTHAIQKWIDKEADIATNWIELDTYIADETSQLMADSAFNILLAQANLTAFQKRENILVD